MEVPKPPPYIIQAQGQYMPPAPNHNQVGVTPHPIPRRHSVLLNGFRRHATLTHGDGIAQSSLKILYL